jgi:hypothetical protein
MTPSFLHLIAQARTTFVFGSDALALAASLGSPSEIMLWAASRANSGAILTLVFEIFVIGIATSRVNGRVTALGTLLVALTVAALWFGLGLLELVESVRLILTGFVLLCLTGFSLRIARSKKSESVGE